MLLDFDTAGSMDAGLPAAADRCAPVSLLDRVRQAFPTLVVHRSRVEHSGGDHLVLVVNDDHAFRFPRAGMHGLGFEVAVLRQLGHRSPVPVPAYRHVDPAGRLAGYRFIEGEALTAERFLRLEASARTTVLDAAAAFLTALHDLPRADIAWTGPWPRTWTAAQFAERALTRRLPLIAGHAPHLARPVEAFFVSYRLDAPDRLAIVHGDLVGEHMLLDRSGSRLAGIIDFGDVALGDPAQDLLGFWSYGGDVVAHVVDRYDPHRADPDLLRRSRNHFVRYRIDDLFECLASGRGAGDSARVAAVEALLSGSTPDQR
jgi:aminoglycoside phosphotransferase (APT) family kinase protein